MKRYYFRQLEDIQFLYKQFVVFAEIQTYDAFYNEISILQGQIISFKENVVKDDIINNPEEYVLFNILDDINGKIINQAYISYDELLEKSFSVYFFTPDAIYFTTSIELVHIKGKIVKKEYVEFDMSVIEDIQRQNEFLNILIWLFYFIKYADEIVVHSFMSTIINILQELEETLGNIAWSDTKLIILETEKVIKKILDEALILDDITIENKTKQRIKEYLRICKNEDLSLDAEINEAITGLKIKKSNINSTINIDKTIKEDYLNRLKYRSELISFLKK